MPCSAPCTALPLWCVPRSASSSAPSPRSAPSLTNPNSSPAESSLLSETLNLHLLFRSCKNLNFQRPKQQNNSGLRIPSLIVSVCLFLFSRRSNRSESMKSGCRSSLRSICDSFSAWRRIESRNLQLRVHILECTDVAILMMNKRQV
jgi:hypothetical protein